MNRRQVGAGVAMLTALLALTGCDQNMGYNTTGTGASAADVQGPNMGGDLRPMTAEEKRAAYVSPAQATANIGDIGSQVGGSGLPHNNASALAAPATPSATSKGTNGGDAGGSTAPSGWTGMYPAVAPTEGSSTSR